jgi:DNA-directed RNA polymerase specialized sigma24 family protein
MTRKEAIRPRFPTEAASGLQLVARAQRGEEAAFWALCEIHKSAVYTTCLRLIGTVKESEEVTRKALLCVFRNILAFEGDSEFTTAFEDLAIRWALAVREERAFLRVFTVISQTRPLFSLPLN